MIGEDGRFYVIITAQVRSTLFEGITDWEEAARQLKRQENKKPAADLPVDNTLKDAIKKRNREDTARAKVLANDFKSLCKIMVLPRRKF